jgi:hypothetical protein
LATSFQRIGSISNTHAGREFEIIALNELKLIGVEATFNFPVAIGCHDNTKIHRFDLGSANPPVIVECKSHRWTSGRNIPSAKLTVWNEAMFYFHLAPARFRKIFFVLKDLRDTESLAEYYIRRHRHMIPRDVEIWEYDISAGKSAQIFG